MFNYQLINLILPDKLIKLLMSSKLLVKGNVVKLHIQTTAL
jgi:hypothetical protein